MSSFDQGFDIAKTLYWQLTGEPQLDSLSELFHENTKILPKAKGFMISAEALRVMSEGFKSYDQSEIIELNRTHPNLPMPLGEAIRRRRSIREYSSKPLSLIALSELLFCSSGQTEDGSRRQSPSAGALYPLELYPIVLRGEDVLPGVYHYNVRRHLLERIHENVPLEQLKQAIFVEEIAQTASVAIIMTAVFGRTKIKYGERGYRFALIEAGHVAQNICLTAVAMGLGACTIGGFIDDYINNIVDIDGVDEATIYIVTIGSIEIHK